MEGDNRGLFIVMAYILFIASVFNCKGYVSETKKERRK